MKHELGLCRCDDLTKPCAIFQSSYVSLALFQYIAQPPEIGLRAAQQMDSKSPAKESPDQMRAEEARTSSYEGRFLASCYHAK